MVKIRRLLSVGHSYCVALNRRLAEEMTRVGSGRWEVRAVAPEFFHGDLGPIRTRRGPFEACGVSLVRAYLTQSLHMFFYGLHLREMLRGSWNLVHCWEEPYVVAGWQVARWTPMKTPWVFWTAQNIYKSYPVPFGLMERDCVNRCAGWIACGETTRASAITRGYDAKPHRIISLGVDVEHFKPDARGGRRKREQLGWHHGGPPVVGFLGRFVEEKGVRMLTKVLDGARSPWRALFIGGGPLESHVRGWAETHGDRVRIVTGVTHDEVPQFLNAMDVLCAPSQTTPRWREQFGRMLVEAFACGVPVIASDSGEIPYVVDQAGMIAGENDHDAWVEGLGRLLENPRLRTEYARRGLERARSEYAWPVIAKKHLEFFDSLAV